MLVAALLFYLGNILTLAFSAIGVGIGQGFAGIGAVEVPSRQSMGIEQSFRTFVIGLALSESGAILALVLVLRSVLGVKFPITVGCGLAELGAGLAMGISAGVIGIASGLAVKSAMMSISRQPLFSQKITTFMLLAQSIVEAPVIFAFIIAVIIKNAAVDMLSVEVGLRYFSGGLVMALGCIGPSVGQAIFVSNSCECIGLNKNAYNKIFTFSLLSQAIIETPVLFSFFVSFILIFLQAGSQISLMAALGSLAAAISMGFGAIGTGVASGFIASKVCRAITNDPENQPLLIRNSFFSQAVVESAAVYSFVVALMIIFK